MLESNMSRPANTKMTTMGISHHFLLVLRKNQKSPRRLPRGWLVATFSNELCSSSFFIRASEGFQITVRGWLRVAFYPESRLLRLAAKLQRIASANAPKKSEWSYHAVKHYGEYHLADQPSDWVRHDGCDNERNANGVRFDPPVNSKQGDIEFSSNNRHDPIKPFSARLFTRILVITVVQFCEGRTRMWL